MRCRARTGVVLAGSLLLAACASARKDAWDAALEGPVGDVDVHVHRTLRNAYVADSLEQVLGHYTLTPPEGGRVEDLPLVRHKRELLGRFADVERGIVSIRRPTTFEHPRPQQVTTFVRTFLTGKSREGRPLVAVEDATMVVDYSKKGKPTIVDETVHRTHFVDVPGGRAFTDVTVPAGITMVADSVGYELRSIVIPDIPLWYGAACGDADDDGRDDLYLVNGGPDRLYRNAGDGTFEDMTARSGLSGTESIGQSAVFCDFDNDGDQDLLVVNLLDPNRLYRNEGGGRFVDATDGSGFLHTPYNTSVAVLDYDRDGLNDVFVVGGGDFVDGSPKPVYEAQNGTPDRLYHNLGGLRFEEVGAKAGVADPGWGLACSCSDYDGDGDTDIYVANDFGMNCLWRNEGDGTFTNVAAEAGVENRGPGMGCTWGDWDGDGRPDLFVSNMFSNSEWMFYHPDYPLPAAWYQRLLFEDRIYDILHEMTQGSAMYRNRGDGTFEDVSDKYDVRDLPQWAWGCTFLDFDNDADLDCYVANGMISGENSKDL
jgi:hypothetical protein